MSYVRQNFVDGQVLKAEHLNHIERGISELESGSSVVFDTFPTEEEVNGMANWSVFTTRGYYDESDGFGCTYVVRNTKGNLFIPYGNMFIRAYCVDEITRDIKPEWYGIRRGSSSTTYAAENSAIMDKLQAVLQNGYTLSFGSGQYYFAKPFVFSKYIMVKGVCTNATVAPSDVNFGTYLHFPSITDGNAAITLNGGGVVEDIGLVGNASICNVTLDRTKTVTAPDSIVTLVDTGTTYGIKTNGSFVIQNVRIRNFTYGIYTPAGNDSIAFVDIRQCKIGISVGNDVKISNVQLWNVVTGIELRGQLASAVNIRGDSIGKHLIECWRGKCLLTNIDGDYCVGSLIHYGGNITYMHLGQATACMGRVATKKAYARTGSFDLSAVADADYEYCSYISIAPNTQVFGGQIDVVNVATNPMDTSSDYVHPDAVISIGSGSTVKGLIVKCNVPYGADTAYFNKNVIKNLSTHAESVNDTTNYLTDFDGKTIEDIMFVTPIGLLRSRRTTGTPGRSVRGDSTVNNEVSEVITNFAVPVPTININDGVWQQGYFDAAGGETGHNNSYATQSFRNANYIPVEGGRSIALYYESAEWNKNNVGISWYIVQYDSNKNIIVQRGEIPNYKVGNHVTYALNADTAYIRVAFHKWADITTPLTDVQAAIYYAEDAVLEFVEHGYIAEDRYGVIGEKVVLTSPNGTQYLLSVSDNGTLSATKI